jgi:hypothetical protein
MNIQLTFKLRDLAELRYYYDKNAVEFNRIEVNLLRRILNLSPNLKIFHLESETPQQFIDLLKCLPIASLKNLTKLKLSSKEILLHVTFLIGLARIISPCHNLKN